MKDLQFSFFGGKWLAMEEHFPPKFTVLFLTWPQFYDTDFAILYGPSRMNVRGSTSTTPPLAPPSLFSRNIGFQCWNKKPGQNGQNRTITALSSTTLLSFFFKLYFVRSISTFSAPVLFSTKNVRKIEIAQVKMAPTFYTYHVVVCMMSGRIRGTRSCPKWKKKRNE